MSYIIKRLRCIPCSQLSRRLWDAFIAEDQISIMGKSVVLTNCKTKVLFVNAKVQIMVEEYNALDLGPTGAPT